MPDLLWDFRERRFSTFLELKFLPRDERNGEFFSAIRRIGRRKVGKRKHNTGNQKTRPGAVRRRFIYIGPRRGGAESTAASRPLKEPAV